MALLKKSVNFSSYSETNRTSCFWALLVNPDLTFLYVSTPVQLPHGHSVKSDSSGGCGSTSETNFHKENQRSAAFMAVDALCSPNSPVIKSEGLEFPLHEEYINTPTNQKVDHLRLLNTSFFEHVHPEEITSARADLAHFITKGNLYGTTTRCRFRVAKSAKVEDSNKPIHNCFEPQTPVSPFYPTTPSMEMHVPDVDFIVMDVTMNVVCPNLTLAFFHVAGGGDTCRKTTLNTEDIGHLERQLADLPSPTTPSSEFPLPPGAEKTCISTRVLQILSEDTGSLLFAHPAENLKQLIDGATPSDHTTGDWLGRLYHEDDCHKLRTTIAGLRKTTGGAHGATRPVCFRPKLHTSHGSQITESMVISWGGLTFICTQLASESPESVVCQGSNARAGGAELVTLIDLITSSHGAAGHLPVATSMPTTIPSGPLSGAFAESNTCSAQLNDSLSRRTLPCPIDNRPFHAAYQLNSLTKNNNGLTVNTQSLHSISPPIASAPATLPWLQKDTETKRQAHDLRTPVDTYPAPFWQTENTGTETSSTPFDTRPLTSVHMHSNSSQPSNPLLGLQSPPSSLSSCVQEPVTHSTHAPSLVSGTANYPPATPASSAAALQFLLSPTQHSPSKGQFEEVQNAAKVPVISNTSLQSLPTRTRVSQLPSDTTPLYLKITSVRVRDATVPASTERKRCESCGTTRSPEWRRGPSGHKTLCNACGLRYSRSLARAGKTTAQAAQSTSQQQIHQQYQRQRHQQLLHKIQLNSPPSQYIYRHHPQHSTYKHPQSCSKPGSNFDNIPRQHRHKPQPYGESPPLSTSQEDMHVDSSVPQQHKSYSGFHHWPNHGQPFDSPPQHAYNSVNGNLPVLVGDCCRD